MRRGNQKPPPLSKHNRERERALHKQGESAKKKLELVHGLSPRRILLEGIFSLVYLCDGISVKSREEIFSFVPLIAIVFPPPPDVSHSRDHYTFNFFSPFSLEN